MSTQPVLSAPQILIPLALAALAWSGAQLLDHVHDPGSGSGSAGPAQVDARAHARTSGTRAEALDEPLARRELDHRRGAWADGADESAPRFDPSAPVTRLRGAELELPEVRVAVGRSNALSVANALNEFVVPETQACIAATHERDPELAGRLAMRFVLEADPDGGSAVGDMETLDDNEIRDEELLACIRGSVAEAIFPAPMSTDPEFLELSLSVKTLAG